MNELQLKKIIKEELIKEMDIGTGLAIAGGSYLAYKGLAFLIAVISGVRKGIKAGVEEANFKFKALGSMILDPEVIPILKKLHEKQEILDAIAKGDLDEAGKIIKESGLLTPEEEKTIEQKFNFVRGTTKLNRMATRMKYNLPDN